MSSLWDVPAYLIMAFSLAFDAPAGKASRVAYSPSAENLIAGRPESPAILSERAWLRAIKLASPRSDILSVYGTRIFVTSSGRYYIPSAGDRRDIAAMQENREVAIRVLFAAALELKTRLKRETGISPTRGALLLAYFYGRKSATSYLRALSRGGGKKVSQALPRLAKTLAIKKDMTFAALEERLEQAFHAKPPVAEVAAAKQERPDRRAIKGTFGAAAVPSAADGKRADSIAGR